MTKSPFQFSLPPAGKILGLEGLSRGAASFFIAHQMHDANRPAVLLITQTPKEAKSFAEDLRFFLGDETPLIEFISLDVVPYHQLTPKRDTIAERLRLLHQLSTLEQTGGIVIASVAALIRKVIPRHRLRSLTFDLNQHDELHREKLIEKLITLGYERVPLVEDVGTFSVRGSLIDIFSPAHDYPARIEFFDDLVESIRFFDPARQTSTGHTPHIQILPALETLTSELPKDWTKTLKNWGDALDCPRSDRETIEEDLQNKIQFAGIETFLSLFYESLGTLFDYLPSRLTVMTTSLDTIQTHLKESLHKISDTQAKATSLEKIVPPASFLLSEEEFLENLSLYPVIDCAGTLQSSDQLVTTTETNKIISDKIKSLINTPHALDPLVTELNQKRQEGWHLFVVASSPAQEERLADLLRRYKIPLQLITETESATLAITRALKQEPASPFIYLLAGNLTEGFIWPDIKQWWITDGDLFGKKGKKLAPQKPVGEVFSSFADLQEGDYIVHLDHGIGLYKGLTTLKLGVFENDFILLEYLGGDKLYLPIDKLGRICRYNISEGGVPLLDKLGGTSWQRLRDKVKTATRKLARQLLEIQALRQTQKGHPFTPPDTLYEEFEATFQFEETPDQLRAIEDVLKDMQSERPMDRLVCGDVGYGKTEVALRAAFKAIEDKKQVIVLVPTTVLALQHFATFSKRLKDYPVTIGMLSRFRTAAEQKQVIEGLKNGSVDIVVATHRILSNDIIFRDLGLLIIDEEHRFGVGHKEKIKKLKNMVDVLTLSATPIPRTLNFAMVGIRDLSLINTPPEDRLAIRTFVTPFDDMTVKEAILHEINRGGQIYFVHNRVQSIYQMQERLQKLVPGIKIGVGHGQMAEGELEEVMIGFLERRYDILLATTIVESGLDIPSANTIFINRADALGLAQLYQLRGRVGRSNQRAYCYLLIPHESLLTDIAKRRLSVIRRFTELGSGFKIASHDLELRGAGNILGGEQSGHMAAMGYDLYVSLLKQAVDELAGKTIEEEWDTEIKIDIPASIPADLVADTQVRLALYRQLTLCKTTDEVKMVQEEWTDRFGKLPEPIENLLQLITIKVRAKKLGFKSVTITTGAVTLGIHPQSPIPTSYFIERIRREPKKCSLLPEGKFIIRENNLTSTNSFVFLNRLMDELEKVRG